MRSVIHILNVMVPYRWLITVILVALILFLPNIPPPRWVGRLAFRAGMLHGYLRARMGSKRP